MLVGRTGRKIRGDQVYASQYGPGLASLGIAGAGKSDTMERLLYLHGGYIIDDKEGYGVISYGELQVPIACLREQCL